MKFKDFKGNFKQILEFKEFLKNEKKSSIIIVGDNCTGKTTFYTMLQNENIYDILLLNENNFSESTISNFIECKTITSFFNPREKIVFIDDIDTISSMNKNIINLIYSLKQKCKMIFTVKLKEEKKIVSNWKKVIDNKIYLAKLTYKDCFQVMLHLLKDRVDIDDDRLLQLIKAQNCNITNILMLIDNVTHKNEDLIILDSHQDLFHNNVYTNVSDVYNELLTDDYIDSLCKKDNSLLSSMLHENLVHVKHDIDTYIDIYETITYCDIVDKHIYINCSWGTNMDLLNKYRFTKFNRLLNKNNKNKPFNVIFTRQFTNLSSQMNIKKKLQNLSSVLYITNTFDILHHFKKKQYDEVNSDKVLKDLVNKFTKDYNVI
jgi:hypothetical protein